MTAGQERHRNTRPQSYRGCFGIQFSSDHVRSHSKSDVCPRTRVCFVTPGTFESSVLAATRNEFRYHRGSYTETERGRKAARAAERVFGGERMAGHSIDSLLRMQGRSFRPLSLPVSLFIPLSVLLFISPSFSNLLPINTLILDPPRSDSSVALQQDASPSALSYTIAGRILFFLLPSFLLRSFYPVPTFPPHLHPSLSVLRDNTRLRPPIPPRRLSLPLVPTPLANPGGRGRKGVTRRTGLSNPHPRGNKTPVEG